MDSPDNQNKYAISLPDLVQFLFTLNTKTQKFLSSLSPQVKKSILYSLNLIVLSFMQIFSFMKSIYPAVMKFGDAPVENWKQPSRFILRPLGWMILFIWPVNDEWESLPETKFMMIGNQQVYGLGSISLVAAIHRKTSVWVRLVMDELNFKIPVWKHLVQYFGAVPATQENIKTLIENNQSLLVYPGGRREFLKPRLDQRYDLNFDLKMVEFLQSLSELHQYPVVPFAYVGASDMVKILIDLPFGDMNVPCVIPVSYQRQYLQVGSTNPNAIFQISKLKNMALERQGKAGDRYLLAWLTRVLHFGGQKSYDFMAKQLASEPKIKEL